QSIDSVEAGAWDRYVYQGAPPVISNPMVSFSIAEVATVGDAISLDYFRPIDILTFAEVLFIQGEAASRGYISGDAKALYERGIEASMEKWGVDAPELITQYTNGSFAAYDPSNATEQILTQRYID